MAAHPRDHGRKERGNYRLVTHYLQNERQSTVTSEYVRCPTCTGSGCTSCNYRGSIESAENWCRGCDGVGCDDCDGTGEYRPTGFGGLPGQRSAGASR